MLNTKCWDMLEEQCVLLLLDLQECKLITERENTTFGSCAAY